MMKALVVALVLSLASTSFAEDNLGLVLQATYNVITVVDWAQTRYIAANKQYYERNPILGRHPSLTKVDIYFASGLVASNVISYLLPEKYRHIWQSGGIALEVACVANNAAIGVKMKF